MIRYWNNREYKDSRGLAKDFTRDYGFNVSAEDVNHVCGTYGVPKKVANGMTFYDTQKIWDMRCRRKGFRDVLYNITVFGDARGSAMYDKEKEESIDYTPYESSMENVNQDLLDKYQFEGKRFKKLIENMLQNLNERKKC